MLDASGIDKVFKRTSSDEMIMKSYFSVGWIFLVEWQVSSYIQLDLFDDYF